MEGLVKYGRWKVLKEGLPYIYPSGKKSRRMLCRCDCGTERLVHLAHLKNGSSKSCGCLCVEISTTHGKSGSRSYKAWVNMLQRIKDPSINEICYEGLMIQDSWIDSFENFHKDMGDCPDGFELDRIDSTVGYFSWNCKWSSEVDQAGNRRMFKNNTSGKTGVVWSKSHEKWRVTLVSNKVKYEGGLHETLESAIRARIDLEIRVLGKQKYT